MTTTKETVTRLAKVPLFSDCSQRDLQTIARVVREIPHAAGTVIAREGDPGVGLFVILDGTADVTIGGRKKATLGPGDFFGEIALLDGGPRTATVTAKTDVKLLGLTEWVFRGSDGGASVDRPEDAATDGGAAAFAPPRPRPPDRSGVASLVRRRSWVTLRPSGPGAGRGARRAACREGLRRGRRPPRPDRGSRVDGRRRARRLAAGAGRSPTWCRRTRARPHDVVSRPGRARHGRRVDPLGRRGVAARTSPRDRFVPGERGRSRRPVRRRRRDRRAGRDVGRRRGGGAARARAPAGARPATPGSSGRAAAIVLAMDGSIEATGDVLGPLEAALADPDRRRRAGRSAS